MAQRPIDDSLFTWPADSPQLIGGKCDQCGTVTFPNSGACPQCASPDVSDHLLSRQGTLWTFTIQGFMPKEPFNSGETAETFRPYGVGYIELPGEVKVEARLTESDPSRLEIGMPMELVIVPFRTDDDGDELITFAFAPAA